MKSLSDYTQGPMTQLFTETGAFFAFSEDQLKEKTKSGVKYVAAGSGLVVEKEHYKRLIDGLELIISNGIAQDLNENGKNGVIRRELFNHESFYTNDITDCLDSLDRYNISPEEVAKAFSHIKRTEADSIY